MLQRSVKNGERCCKKDWGYGKILLVCRKKSRTFKWKGENKYEEMGNT